MKDHYTLFGSYASYYTAKTRGYLRKKGIPFIERLPRHPDFRDKVRPVSGTAKIPQIFCVTRLCCGKELPGNFHLTILIPGRADCSPEITLLTINLDENLINEKSIAISLVFFTQPSTYFDPNLLHHNLIDSWVTIIPR